MKLSFSIATEADAPALVALQNAVADDLTRRFGVGPGSGKVTERAFLFGMRYGDTRYARVLIARRGKQIAGKLRLQTKKPWAIDVAYFTPVKKALYLVGMSVAPQYQHKGIGRSLIEEAVQQTRCWPGDAIRLDAFDAESGAGGFYAKCGFSECGRVVYRNTPCIYYELVL
jgi:GNAT superfamily N-acetyltransferase